MHTNTIRKQFGFLTIVTLLFLQVQAQPLKKTPGFTKQDTLRGSLNEERTGWNVLHYTISVTPDYNKKFISGSNDIRFMVVKDFQKMQIDLQEPMEIVKASWKGRTIPFSREGNAFHLTFPQKLKAGCTENLLIEFQGNPRVAQRPPWDGGWIFSKDKQGRPWMSVACQGLGASVWYPCKDHQSDEPDKGALFNITVPDTLMAVANGRQLENGKATSGFTTYSWQVVNPINNYNIVPYIGKYVNWTETFKGEKGDLDCSYWVLDYELDKAKEQFKQVPKMLKSFEYWFGPYPFYEDGYKLVQSPHLGMEHQSAVAYGNRFQNGYLGRDLSGTGWGTKWDFIIVHESGHEWFANNITSFDIADMWVHEGFTNYSETLFTTSEYGVEAGNDYVIGTRKLISNDIPVIGPYGVNQEGSGDMYYKGGNLLHTIRQLFPSDEAFRQTLRGLNSQFYHGITTSKDVENYISEKAGIDLSVVFDQYLRTTTIPTLQYKISGNELSYRWINCLPGFAMKVKVQLGSEARWITPNSEWNRLTMKEAIASFKPDRNFYILTESSK